MSGNLTHIALDWLLRIQQSPEDVELRTGLATWLAQDSRHVDAYRQAQRVWQVTGSRRAEVVQAPQVVVMPAAASRRRRRWPALLTGALAACLVLFIAPGAYLDYRSDYRTALGERRTVELDDGSRVYLDGGSAIAVAYHEGQRGVHLLAGQAFFEVAPDPARPFTVDAEALRITVTGTAFNVALRPSQLAVAVRHGSVRVEEGERLLAAHLGAGDRLRWRRDERQALRDSLPASQIAAWQQQQLVVRDARIADVLEELRSYLPGTLTLRDGPLGEQRVTGVYDLRDPDAALRAVLRPYQGEVRTWTPWLRVISRHND